ncbi:acid sphingomyelinase-like phosphodiesterase 3b [Biomphalaria glabrata]|nr:acid sphingomyelinase-like phosphodiesterase 3b [Biomphalaria glabrata]
MSYSCFIIAGLFSIVYGDIGYFWHVTDFHYDHTYWTSQLSCNNPVPNPGKYGDYWCDSPWTLVQDSVNSMANIRRQVDFVLWTGDNVAHISDSHMSLDINLSVLENITSALKNSFPGIPFYPSLGNHDYYPSDQAGERILFYSRVSDLWQDWIKDPVQIELFKKGGYYTKLINPKLRILALNTVLYLSEDKLTANMSDPAGQFQWIDSVLNASRAANEKVIITGHVSPTFLVPTLLDWFHPRFHQPYVDLMTKYSDIIVAHHYGHDHSDSFKILQRSDGSGASPVFTAPSITPWRYKIPTETGAPHNPGIRLVEYDRETGRHLNYHQYYINLTDSNTSGVTRWTELYDFVKTYNVSDMSVASLRKIYNVMQNAGTKPMLHICSYMYVTDESQPCLLSTQAGIYCGGHISDMDKAKICLNEYVHPVTVIGRSS